MEDKICQIQRMYQSEIATKISDGSKKVEPQVNEAMAWIKKGKEYCMKQKTSICTLPGQQQTTHLARENQKAPQHLLQLSQLEQS